MTSGSISKALAAAIWLAVLGLQLPLARSRPAVVHHAAPPGILLVLALVPTLFFGFAAALAPLERMRHSRFGAFVDARFGAQTWDRFRVQLRPLLLFAAFALETGAFLLGRTGPDDPNAVFMLGGAVAFAVAYLVLYARHAPGIYPTWTLAEGSPPRPRVALPLVPALRAYGWTLVPLGLFPVGMTIARTQSHEPSALHALPFVAVSLLAMAPVLSGRARPSFWLVAMAVWGVGILMLIPLHYVLRAVSG